MKNMLRAVFVIGFFGLAFNDYASDKALQKEREKELDEKFAQVRDVCQRGEAISSAHIDELKHVATRYGECFEGKERIRIFALISALEASRDFLVDDDQESIPRMVQALEEFSVHEDFVNRSETERMIRGLKNKAAKNEQSS